MVAMCIIVTIVEIIVIDTFFNLFAIGDVVIRINLLENWALVAVANATVGHFVLKFLKQTFPFIAIAATIRVQFSSKKSFTQV